MPRSIYCAGAVIVAVALACAPSSATAQAYNPYAGAPEPPPPPLAADGTVQWGTFYKSAALQKAYERLWNLGACRGTNKAITKPVEGNKVIIDRLPEAGFTGTVQATAGTNGGGLIAFSLDGGGAVYVAHLHPAGVTDLAVSGPLPIGAITNGMTVRLRANVDDKGRGRGPVHAIEVVTPPPTFTPDPVEPGTLGTVVGRVVSIRGSTMIVHVDAGRLRRLTLDLADDVTLRANAAHLELIAPGDRVEVTGRLWSGEGAMADGSVFASAVIAAKADR